MTSLRGVTHLDYKVHRLYSPSECSRQGCSKLAAKTRRESSASTLRNDLPNTFHVSRHLTGLNKLKVDSDLVNDLKNYRKLKCLSDARVV